VRVGIPSLATILTQWQFDPLVQMLEGFNVQETEAFACVLRAVSRGGQLTPKLRTIQRVQRETPL
jgi:hypothetical protein